MTDVLAVLTLAHPLTERGELPVSPLFLAAVALVVHTGGTWAARRRITGAREGLPPVWTRRLDPPKRGVGRVLFVVTRVLGLALLVLAIAAGRFGDDAQLANIAPALVMGAGWPLLVLASAVVGHVWWWVDPLDTVGRAVAPLGAGDGAVDDAPAVWWATPVAVVWVAYLTMWPGNLEPRTIGAAVGIYVLVTLAGCMAFGRRTWLSRAEVFGIFFSLIAEVRARRGAVQPPAGAHILLAVLAGGFTYGLLRDSQLLATVGYGPRATWYAAAALGAVVLATAGAAHLLARHEQRLGGHGALAVGLVPSAVALAIVLAMARNRFTTSLQLLPIVASDPFGVGLDLLGTRYWSLNPQPLGSAGLIGAQVGVLVVGHLLAIAVAHRRVAALPTPRPARAIGPATAVIGGLLVVAVAAAGATVL